MTEAEFYGKVRKKYGSRGVRQAKEFMEEKMTQPSIFFRDEEAMMEFWQTEWLTAKQEAHDKYTPMKYRGMW